MSGKITPKIGIVSGIGPLAGADVLAKLFKYTAEKYGAAEDCDYPDVVFVNHGIPGVDSAGTLNIAFENAIVSMVSQLESNGANIIGIACNTAHVYLDKIKVKPTTLLVNLIEEVAKEASNHCDKYLLLTSEANKKSALYPKYLKKYGVKFGVVTKSQQSQITKVIGAIMSHKLDDAGKIMETILAEAKENGYTGIIAGCTELPIAIAHAESTLDLKVIASNDVLAAKMMDTYMN
jgi:aspartate racemase